MLRAEVYATLAPELEFWRLPFVDLVSFVGTSPSVKKVAIGSLIIDVEECVRWAETGRDAIHIEAVANGPSCWRLERLEESVTISAPRASEPEDAWSRIAADQARRVDH